MPLSIAVSRPTIAPVQGCFIHCHPCYLRAFPLVYSAFVTLSIILRQSFTHTSKDKLEDLIRLPETRCQTLHRFLASPWYGATTLTVSIPCNWRSVSNSPGFIQIVSCVFDYARVLRRIVFLANRWPMFNPCLTVRCESNRTEPNIGPAGSLPSNSNWTFETGPETNFSRDVLGSSPQNISLSGDSQLYITPLRDQVHNTWTSAKIYSNPSFRCDDGHKMIFQGQLRLGNNPNQIGIWPAFWALGEALRMQGPQHKD